MGKDKVQPTNGLKPAMPFIVLLLAAVCALAKGNPISAVFGYVLYVVALSSRLPKEMVAQEHSGHWYLTSIIVSFLFAALYSSECVLKEIDSFSYTINIISTDGDNSLFDGNMQAHSFAAYAICLIVLLLVAFAVNRIVSITYRRGKEGACESYRDRLIARGTYTYRLAACVFSIGITVATYCYGCARDVFSNLDVFLLLSQIPFPFFLVYKYVQTFTTFNKWFFRRIIHCDSSVCVQSKQSNPDSQDNFMAFLNMLGNPQAYFLRINDHIEPDHGSFMLRSEYEIQLDWVGEDESEIIIPITLQSKTELTNALHFESIDGSTIRRMSEKETRAYMTDALRSYLCDEQVPKKDADKMAEIAFAHMFDDFGLDFESEDDLEDFIGDSMRSIDPSNLLPEDARNFLANLLRELRYVRPICIKIKPTHTCHGGLRLCCATTIRYVPMVPVRNNWNFTDSIRRAFSKHRMKYYFGLGNADRCRSYHLTFTGPKNTYLVESVLAYVGNRNRFALASSMSISNRYDQRNSRLYIRDGRGFSKVALGLSYEERTHRPIQALCAQSIVSLIMLLYLSISHVFNAAAEGIGASDIAMIVGILALSGLVSVWEAMDRHRAEEWVWVLSASTLAASLVAVLVLVLGQEVNANQHLPGNGITYVYGGVWKFLWSGCLVWLAMTAMLSFLGLFKDVKQHGAFLDKVPYTTRIESSNNRLPVKDLLDEGGSSSIENPNSSTVPESSMRFPRYERYTDSIKVYRGMINDTWNDGWLIPTWVSLLDPYNADSEQFRDNVKDC